MDELRIDFDQADSEAVLQEHSDQEFLKAVVWDRTAPKPLTEAAKNGDVTAFCRRLQRSRFGTARGGGGKRAASSRGLEKPSLWSREAFEQTAREVGIVQLWERFRLQSPRSRRTIGAHRGTSRSRSTTTGRGLTKNLLQWLNGVEGPLSPLECLIVHEMMFKVGHQLPVEACWLLWRSALTTALHRVRNPGEPEPSKMPAYHKLVIDGELSWQAGLLFAGIKGASRVGRSGQRVLRKELLDQTDTDGTPEAELLECLPLWMAPLVRSTEWARRFRIRLWDEEATERFRGLTKIVAPLCRPDGKLALSNGFRSDPLSLLTSAARLAGWTGQSRPMKYLQAVGNRDRKQSRSGVNGSAPVRSGSRPATQSDWARLACLCNAWTADADTLVVAHHREQPMIDLAMLGRPLLAGTWPIAVTVDGNPIQIDDEWTCTCWFSDPDADFMELHADAEQGVQFYRQVLLSRTDHFALLADVVSEASGRRIEYTSRLPLAESVVVEPDTATRECVLKTSRRGARAFPLALPSERVMSTPGAFGPAGETLELRQTAIGGLYAPVVLDWDPSRRRSYADWRTLTVTEQRRILKSEAASGHRLRIGDHQLLIYRSLTRSEEARAVLGHHTTDETVIGRFDSDGDLDPIIAVE